MTFVSGGSLEVTGDIGEEFSLEGMLTLYGAQNADGTYALTGSLSPAPDGQVDDQTLSLALSGSIAETALYSSGIATFNGPLAGELGVALHLELGESIVMGPFFAWQGPVKLTGTLAGEQLTLLGDDIFLGAVPVVTAAPEDFPLQFGEDCDVGRITTTQVWIAESWECTLTSLLAGDSLELGVIVSPSGFAAPTDARMKDYIYNSTGYQVRFYPDTDSSMLFNPQTAYDLETVPIWGLELIRLSPIESDGSLTFRIDVNCSLVDTCSITGLNFRVWLVVPGTQPLVLIREFNFVASYQAP